MSKLLFQTPREDRNETQLQSSQEGHRPVRPRERKSFDCWACGEMGRGLAGQAQQGQVLRWSVNSHRLQEAWSHHLRQSKAPLVGLDISCHPHPCSEALLFVYWDDFKFQQWVYLGGQKTEGISLTPPGTWWGCSSLPPVAIRLQSWTRKCRSSGEMYLSYQAHGAEPTFREGLVRKMKESIFSIKCPWEMKAAVSRQAGDRQPYSPWPSWLPPSGDAAALQQGTHLAPVLLIISTASIPN